ncbi:hypothetical protein GE21DRAFT_530 [Neurospora crassa]|uniref:Uncharacterized protein n=1 Tax=Neurospora crassa (strain ATCC 24698 / 74-OR23-1A / CBS 708.71 / DSM 1257 / FGSC 987) TaxID=367110 RepID=Q7SH86_NEUCR|nr:hypothetical protein NCU01920 [Neurospora crassa OR74A]EAA36315.2 hypothetical protein NCU01920 [Neurospora crassa OR74A]KHE83016.1 hypothetical protein GE21DRAFT_530 [Neurospora crassa]|eukprot:XP_965551.2 hypothetical protein NCU01920 [Neurospora crassa OR74A]
MATGPVKRVAASALNTTAKIAKATASKHSPLRSAPASPTVAAKPTGVKTSNPLSQSPPPAITTTPASSSSSSSPLSPTTELTERGSSGGAPSPPGGSGGGGAGRGQQPGKGQEEAPHQQSRPFPKWKAAVWTVAFTAVTVTGTIYGAGLKTQKEWNQEKQKIQEATADDKIEMLVNRRAQLFKTKIEIEQKLADVRERMRLEKEKEEKVKSGAVATPRR